MNVNRYHFDTIITKTKKMVVFPIMRGEENDLYFDSLALLEIKLYDFHLKYGIKGRQAKEILQLVLFDIKSIAEHKDYNCSQWEEEIYRDCADAIETLFIPEKNPVLESELIEPHVMDDDYFNFARKNIIRIWESVEQWTKLLGPDGYFIFLSDFMGTEIRTDMKYLVEDDYLK